MKNGCSERFGGFGLVSLLDLDDAEQVLDAAVAGILLEPLR